MTYWSVNVKGEGSSRMEISGSSGDVSSADRASMGNHGTNGEVSNKTNVICKSTSNDQKSSDSDSDSDTSLARFHSRPSRNLGSRLLRHQKRRIVERVPYSLMSSAEKQTRKTKERERKKKTIRKLEQKLKNGNVLSQQKRKRIKRRLKRLRQHSRKRYMKKKATESETDKGRSSRK